MLQHANRSDPVECALNIAVIHQFKFDFISDACGFRTLLTEFDLIRRERHTEHFDPIHFMQIHGEAAPSTAYVQNAHAFSLTGLHI